MNDVVRFGYFLTAVAMIAGASTAAAQTRGKPVLEDYVREPMPPGISSSTEV